MKLVHSRSGVHGSDMIESRLHAPMGIYPQCIHGNANGCQGVGDYWLSEQAVGTPKGASMVSSCIIVEKKTSFVDCHDPPNLEVLFPDA